MREWATPSISVSLEVKTDCRSLLMGLPTPTPTYSTLPGPSDPPTVSPFRLLLALTVAGGDVGASEVVTPRSNGHSLIPSLRWSDQVFQRTNALA